MFSATATITNQTGLHARPASGLVELCKKFESKITLRHGELLVDPKSIISILAAGIKQGTTVELIAEGPDEEIAGQEVLAFIQGLVD